MVISLYGKVINKQLDFKGDKYINPVCNPMNNCLSLAGKEQDMLIINNNLSAVKIHDMITKIQFLQNRHTVFICFFFFRLSFL